MIEFRILGPFEVLEHDRPRAFGGPKVRALLAVLLLHRGEVVSTDRLIDALWGERASDDRGQDGSGVCVEPAQGAGRWAAGHPRARILACRPSRGQVDSDRFEALAADGRAPARRPVTAAGGRAAR